MEFKSVVDLVGACKNKSHLIDESIDLVVGIPRSGMLPATVIALNKNLPVVTLSEFLENKEILTGSTRIAKKKIKFPFDAKKVLLVDDSSSTGGSINDALSKIKNCLYSGSIVTLVVYGVKGSKNLVDIPLEITSPERIFEWNLFHRKEAANYCVDIDGVLCLDPTNRQNDDGVEYVNFLNNAQQISFPSYKIGHLVTGRLEKYRGQTERWLSSHGISYGSLHMVDLPDAETRRKKKVHAAFKADVFSKHKDCVLFIESESLQAVDIYKLSGKPCLDFGNMRMANSSFVTPQIVGGLFSRAIKKAINKIR